MTQVDPNAQRSILQFVDSIVPGGGDSVWLTGSRARGDARPDSDWDVLVITRDAPRAPEKLFESNQLGPTVGGGIIELVIAHPDHWHDPRPYMADCRTFGIRLR